MRLSERVPCRSVTSLSTVHLSPSTYVGCAMQHLTHRRGLRFGLDVIETVPFRDIARLSIVFEPGARAAPRVPTCSQRAARSRSYAQLSPMPAMRSLPAVMAAAHACRLVSDDDATHD